MKIITDERCTGYQATGHPERPARIAKTLDLLRATTDLSLQWDAPLPVTRTQLERAHKASHIDLLKSAPRDFDGDTPAYENIYAHASRSVGGALQALKSARKGEPSFNLMRPPGHHATPNRAMGFCYLNSVAISALEAREAGVGKVAVFDFDVHHGNGTEDILVDQENIAFLSVHQHPCYPGTGTKDRGKNCFNFPVAPHTPRMEYRTILTKALESLKSFKPDLVAVSAGFDAYAQDPLAQGTLEKEDFYWLGQAVKNLNIPAFSLLEGGYSDDLPHLILAYLKGLTSY